ncbi:PREDICTED: protein hook [Nicrophorus vespilloides]|uniref:Protein hook n=1 Tax=Nicrophorus vespilloides TaxID=110193 RepID=A0ABM1NGM9_NICVS|nr:PREDICTED: protein hook [Nicrophorus vespilloides]
MGPSEEVCKSLVKWLQSLVPTHTRTLLEISDGVAILEALLKISPANFYKLQGKMKVEVGNNWRLKVSNLKKINEAIIEYYQDVLNFQLLDIGRPDLQSIGERGDLIQVGKLLRLVLGCAVNCERKKEYITQIMALEESVQQCIMHAIVELQELTDSPDGTSLKPFDSKIIRLETDLEGANEAKDRFAQQCHNLEAQVQLLQEEKQALVADNELLANQIKEQQTTDIPRGLESRKQFDLLKEEIFKLETIRDDYAAKVVDQEKQILTLQEKIAELHLTAEATSKLKDEVDALTESADKVKALEITINSYKKKLEDYADIKKQLKLLEDKSDEYLKQNLKYEEELKKYHMWKNQSELYKSEVNDLQQKLEESLQELHKVRFQHKTLQSKIAALQGEKERTARQRDMLRDENEELRLATQKEQDGAAMSQEVTQIELKDRLKLLEKENRLLRSSNHDVHSKQVLLDEHLSRIEKLTEQNRAANQKIIETEAQLEEQKTVNKEFKQKIAHQQEVLERNTERAREVASALQGTSNGNIDPLRHNNIKEEENRLITTSYYRLGLHCHREAVDERLALLSAGQGQSFLSRQRQPMPRKPGTPFKSK